MRLSEAMQINQRPVPEGGATRRIHLACGFTPLHLATYLRAYARQRFPEGDAEVITGLYGDTEGALRNAATDPADGVVLVLEWATLDARLGLRSAAEWSAAAIPDIGWQIEERLGRVERLVSDAAKNMPVAIVAPTIAALPLSHTPLSQSGRFELGLRRAVQGFLDRAAESARVRVVSEEALARCSPHADRHDVQLDLRADFPYTLNHAAAVAGLAIECLFPRPPKKGLITDLDETLWQGILGDAGVDGVAWSLESHAQAHGLYQQLLGSLAEAGVLVAGASKNDPVMVDEVFARSDMRLRRSQIFPLEVGWGPKSESVRRILQAWNIGEDSVLFVDDSRMELAEVGERFPGIECLQFPSGNAAGILRLIRELRNRFAKSEVLEEDRLRTESLRRGARFQEERDKDPAGDFLARLEARLTLGWSSSGNDARALELVNKTNQFNLNGRRLSDGEWAGYFREPGAFLLTATYDDRFGPLGKIAALVGRRESDIVRVDAWVLSCRAFSRHIEYRMLRHLFEEYCASSIGFAFQATARNLPLREFFGHFLPAPLSDGRLDLAAGTFAAGCPPLFHQVIQKNG